MKNELISEKNYAADMANIVAPYLAQRREDIVFPGYDKKELHAARFTADNPQGTVSVLHGFTESIEKYREFIYELLCHGYNVCMLDQRGHGLSYRKVEDKTLTHIDRFEEYVKDMDCFVRDVASGMPGPHFLFSHSMGGAVSGARRRFLFPCGVFLAHDCARPRRLAHMDVPHDYRHVCAVRAGQGTAVYLRALSRARGFCHVLCHIACVLYMV